MYAFVFFLTVADVLAVLATLLSASVAARSQIPCEHGQSSSAQDLCEMIRVLADDQQLSANIRAAAAALETKPNATHAHGGDGEQSSAHETVDAQTVLWQARKANMDEHK